MIYVYSIATGEGLAQFAPGKIETCCGDLADREFVKSAVMVSSLITGMEFFRQFAGPARY